MSEVISLHKDDAPANPGFCLTPTARDITSLLTFCQRYGQIGVVVGDSGTGKSTAVQAFQEAHSGVVYCRMTKAAAKLQPGLVRLAHGLGAYVSQNGGANELYQDIRRTLELRSDLLLILDEAQYMDDELLESVRDLYDESNDPRQNRQMGLVLVGNHGLTDRWSDRSAKRRKFNNFKQLRGRLGPMLDLRAPTVDDVSALCAHHGITGRQACGMIAKVATAPGGLHNVANLLRVAVQLAGPGAAISPRHLDEAALVTGGRS